MEHTLADEWVVAVRPVEPADLDRIVLRCWPDRSHIDELFARQGTIGLSAWDGDRCVAQLHGYRIELPGGSNPCWPDWNRWWSHEVEAHVQGLPEGPVWCHACFHVGRTLEKALVDDDPDPQYLGRGIGTALCRASVAWAREQGMAAVLAPGAPDGMYSFAVWSGHLPQRAYKRMGFHEAGILENNSQLPAWATGDSPSHVMDEVGMALASGRPTESFHERLMLFELPGD